MNGMRKFMTVVLMLFVAAAVGCGGGGGSSLIGGGGTSPVIAGSLVTNITTNSATLGFTINPGGITNVQLSYWPDGSPASAIVVSKNITGTTNQNVEFDLASLIENMLYHYVLSVSNGLTAPVIKDGTFKTLNSAPTSDPVVESLGVTDITSTSAVLKFKVTLNGNEGELDFFFNTTGDFVGDPYDTSWFGGGTFSPSLDGIIIDYPFNGNVGLAPGTTYYVMPVFHYNIVFHIETGDTWDDAFGTVMTFTTLP